MSTWKLVTQSFRVLQEEPKLMVFPILSAVAVAAMSIPFLVAIFGATRVGDYHWGTTTWLVGFLWYAMAAFVGTFFNCALAACAQMHFSGQNPQLSDGIHRAMQRVHVILLWALISATIGQFLRWVDSRTGLLGRIAIGLLGFSWNMVTFLIVPVLIMEEGGVMDSIRRSATLLRQTWGEQLISGLAFGWIALLVAIPGVLLGALAANGYPLFLVPAVLWFAGMMAAFTAASEIFNVVLYRYATTGQADGGFDAATLGNALRKS
jgi:Family of unknown function (DUF6159)